MEKRNVIEAQIEQLMGKAAWTHKIQEKQADIYRERGNRAEQLKIALSAITSSGILAVALGADAAAFKILTAIVALLSTGVNLYLKKYDFVSLEKQHKTSAIEWLGLREDYISLIADIRANNIEEEQIVKRRDELLNEFKAVSAKSPITSNKAYAEAGKAIKLNLDDLISEEEINKFLPVELRRRVE